MQFTSTFFIKSLRRKSLRNVINALVCVLGAFFLTIVFISYHPSDPGPVVISTDYVIHNWIGIIGSAVVSMLLFIFGSSSILFIPLLLFLSLQVWHGVQIKTIGDRIIATLMFILSCAMLGAWYRIQFIHSPFVAGGIVGSSLISFFLKRFDPTMVILITHALLFVSFMLATKLSIVQIVCSARTIKYWVVQIIRFVKYSALYCYRIMVYPVRCWQRWYDQLFRHESVVAFEFEDIVHEQLQLLQSSTQHTVPESAQENGAIESETAAQIDGFRTPSTSMFEKTEIKQEQRQAHSTELATILEQKLERFGIAGSVVSIKIGPVVTLFEYQPDIDSKISKIIALEDDLALALQALSIRIIAPIPGKSVVGFEVANKTRMPVQFATLAHAPEFTQSPAQLPLILGVDTIGAPLVVDLATMPHLLLAGATGSGKSVALNTMLCSLLCKRTPDELKLILIDPKRLEFAAYADVPHLLFPIVTNSRYAASVLKWLLNTMQERYELLARAGVRNIADYLKLPAERQQQKLYSIVLMIDELADLMMVAGKEVEESIARIAQMARAAGIHMIVATQRPSVDVITGTIKVNFPCRLSCRVVSKIDSRTILDVGGADKLLGKGDMLYLDASNPLRRVHGAYIADGEIETLAQFWRSQRRAEYIDQQEVIAFENNDIDPGDEDLFQEVLQFLETVDEISISLLQRRFRIGYNRSARIIELLEAQGRILSSDGGKTRKVLK